MYQKKYLKYKSKYLNIYESMMGGVVTDDSVLQTKLEFFNKLHKIKKINGASNIYQWTGEDIKVTLICERKTNDQTNDQTCILNIIKSVLRNTPNVDFVSTKNNIDIENSDNITNHEFKDYTLGLKGTNYLLPLPNCDWWGGTNTTLFHLGILDDDKQQQFYDILDELTKFIMTVVNPQYEYKSQFEEDYKTVYKLFEVTKIDENELQNNFKKERSAYQQCMTNIHENVNKMDNANKTKFIDFCSYITQFKEISESCLGNPRKIKAQLLNWIPKLLPALLTISSIFIAKTNKQPLNNIVIYTKKTHTFTFYMFWKHYFECDADVGICNIQNHYIQYQQYQRSRPFKKDVCKLLCNFIYQDDGINRDFGFVNSEHENHITNSEDDQHQLTNTNSVITKILQNICVIYMESLVTQLIAGDEHDLNSISNIIGNMSNLSGKVYHSLVEYVLLCMSKYDSSNSHNYILPTSTIKETFQELLETLCNITITDDDNSNNIDNIFRYIIEINKKYPEYIIEEIENIIITIVDNLMQFKFNWALVKLHDLPFWAIYYILDDHKVYLKNRVNSHESPNPVDIAQLNKVVNELTKRNKSKLQELDESKKHISEINTSISSQKRSMNPQSSQQRDDTVARFTDLDK